MRHNASQMHPSSARPLPEAEEKRPHSGVVRQPLESCNKPAQNTPTQIPFGAIHVDASGTILEHRQTNARVSFPVQTIVGQQFVAVAPWAADSSFLSAVKSAIECGNSSFHFDFKQSCEDVERSIHVNILASGRRTAWIFISDKTLPLAS